MGNHVAASVNPQKGEIAARLDLSDLRVVITEQEVAHLDLVVGLLARPFEGLGPSLVSEPVANIVGITLKRGQRGKEY